MQVSRQPCAVNSPDGARWSSNLSGWTSGATYRVSFSLAANPDNTLSPQSCLRATTATHQQDYCFNVLNVDGQGTQASSASMGWQRHTFEFTGSPTDHLTFTSLDAPGDAWGPALDNITVEKLVPTTGTGVRHLFTSKSGADGVKAQGSPTTLKSSGDGTPL
jgi:hypothetical protein